jgi:hypothetical protein
MAKLILVGGQLARVRAGRRSLEEKPLESYARSAVGEHNLQPIFLLPDIDRFL